MNNTKDTDFLDKAKDKGVPVLDEAALGQLLSGTSLDDLVG